MVGFYRCNKTDKNFKVYMFWGTIIMCFAVNKLVLKK